MCRDLDTLSRSIRSYAAGFDAAALSPPDAATVVRTCARMEASIASVKALAAAAAAQSDSWKVEGYRSAADQLAHQAGMSPSSARKALQTGQRMSAQPDVARAALAGELTAEQAAAVSDGASADPSLAKELIDRAKWATVPELNQEAARAKAAHADLEARRAAVHAKRCFRRWSDRDGAAHAHLYANPDSSVAIWKAIDPIRRRLIMTRRGSCPNESLEALDHDALVLLAQIATGQSSTELSFADLVDLGLFPQATAVDPPSQAALFPDPDVDPAPRVKKLGGSPDKVIVRVDLDALLRGWPAGGETCEIVGWGPIPVSLIDQLLEREATVLAVALTSAEQVLGVYHHRRHPNARQKTALDLLYPTCAAAGCDARAGLQSDHRRDWQDTGYTALDYLDRLCPHHHKLKTHHGWALIAGTGKRDFVPPHDPRHPAHSSDPGPPPQAPDLPPPDAIPAAGDSAMASASPSHQVPPQERRLLPP